MLSQPDESRAVVVPRDSPGGNRVHAAPEVLTALAAFTNGLVLSTPIDYTGQVLVLCISCFQSVVVKACAFPTDCFRSGRAAVGDGDRAASR